jgi:hypothetical protein
LVLEIDRHFVWYTMNAENKIRLNRNFWGRHFQKV